MLLVFSCCGVASLVLFLGAAVGGGRRRAAARSFVFARLFRPCARANEQKLSVVAATERRACDRDAGGHAREAGQFAAAAAAAKGGRRERQLARRRPQEGGARVVVVRSSFARGGVGVKRERASVRLLSVLWRASASTSCDDGRRSEGARLFFAPPPRSLMRAVAPTPSTSEEEAAPASPSLSPLHLTDTHTLDACAHTVTRVFSHPARAPTRPPAPTERLGVGTERSALFAAAEGIRCPPSRPPTLPHPRAARAGTQVSTSIERRH